MSKFEYFISLFIGYGLVIPIFLFFFVLWITQMLGLGGSQRIQHKTGKLSGYTKDQINIATAIATYGVAPLVGIVMTRYGRKKQ